MLNDGRFACAEHKCVSEQFLSLEKFANYLRRCSNQQERSQKLVRTPKIRGAYTLFSTGQCPDSLKTAADISSHNPTEFTVSSRRNTTGPASELRSLCPFTMPRSLLSSFTLSLTGQQLSFLCFPVLSLALSFRTAAASVRRCH